jgi:GNAT superfamily N-acetyltransferase
MSNRIQLAENDEEIMRCYPVMVELRPHLRAEKFLDRVKQQRETAGFKLAYLLDEEVRAVAGFRVSENLASNRFLYVDDLVSISTQRSKGYGGELFDWLIEYARAEQCQEVHLDSRVQRFAAHRFYLNKRMIIEAHHFTLVLTANSSGG